MNITEIMFPCKKYYKICKIAFDQVNAILLNQHISFTQFQK